MSRRATDPVDAAFARIVALTPEGYARLQERLIGGETKTGLKPVPVPRKRREKSIADAQADLNDKAARKKTAAGV